MRVQLISDLTSCTTQVFGIAQAEDYRKQITTEVVSTNPITPDSRYCVLSSTTGMERGGLSQPCLSSVISTGTDHASIRHLLFRPLDSCFFKSSDITTFLSHRWSLKSRSSTQGSVCCMEWGWPTCCRRSFWSFENFNNASIRVLCSLQNLSLFLFKTFTNHR